MQAVRCQYPAGAGGQLICIDVQPLQAACRPARSDGCRHTGAALLRLRQIFKLQHEFKSLHVASCPLQQPLAC